MPARPKLILAIALAATLGACAVPDSRSNAVVLTGNQAVIEGCTRLGVVEGAPAHRRVLLRDQARDSIIARLKIAAADLGATHVVAAVADPKWSGADSSGTAWRCRV